MALEYQKLLGSLAFLYVPVCAFYQTLWIGRRSVQCAVLKEEDHFAVEVRCWS